MNNGISPPLKIPNISKFIGHLSWV